MAVVLVAAAVCVPAATADAAPRTAATLAGFDISESQGVPDFAAAKAHGAAFAIIKDTAALGYVNPNFLAQFRGAKNAGLIRGSYHYARPDASSGAAQAAYLHDHYGRWYSDGMTLPPALDMEDTPNVPPCYAMPPDAMVAWIRDFSATLKSLTGHTPIIYTTTRWWRACTGDSHAFTGDHVLWLARYAPQMGAAPGGWAPGFWQSAPTGPLPGNQDTWFGGMDGLKALTTGS